ncbi:MAG: hypothetical protein ACJ0DE_03635 [Dehalococcoidia bacterium]
MGNIKNQILFFYVITALLAFISLPSILEGNGRITKYDTHTDEYHIIQYGLYPEKVFTGPLHIALSVQDKDTALFVKSKVNIQITGPSFNESVEAKNSLNSPQYYEYDTVLIDEGNYILDITIESDKGISKINKNFEVFKGANTGNIIVIFLTFTAILIPFSIATRKILTTKSK